MSSECVTGYDVGVILLCITGIGVILLIIYCKLEAIDKKIK